MDPTSDGEGDESALAPDAAFELLADETRMGILRALWAEYDPRDPDTAVPFRRLFDLVGADDTGNFNYHLGRLTGHFVRRTDAGYELAASGFRVVRAVVAGSVTGDPPLPETPVDATCARCGGQVAITHEDGTTWARCTDCEGYWAGHDGAIFGFGLPPRGLRDRDADAVLDATITYSIHRFAAVCRGVCPECGGSVEGALDVCTDHDADGVCDACGSAFRGVLTFACGACTFDWRSPAYAPVSHHPALAAFYDDHGTEHVPATWAAVRRGLR
jgi:hypothetical protein